MKYLTILFAAFALAACSIEGMVEKSVPENVRADHADHIDKLLARDTSLMEKAFDLDLENDETQSQIAAILEAIPDGKEIRRDYVGMNSSSRISVGEGQSRDINLVSEIQTEGGFLTVTSQYALDANGDCCALTNINVAGFESSPVRAGLEAAAKIGKMIGLGALMGVVALAAFLIFRRRRKAAQAEEG